MDDYSKLKAQLLTPKDVRGRVWPRAALKARAAFVMVRKAWDGEEVDKA